MIGPEQVPSAPASDEEQWAEEPPAEPTDYPGPIPEGVEP
jgi:hypothetical protein